MTADLRRLDVQVVDLPTKSDAAAIKTFLRGKMEELRHERFHQEYDLIMHEVTPQMRAVGLPEVCKAASANAVQMLLLDVAPPREGKVCNCGWMGPADRKECPLCQTGANDQPAHIR